MDKSQKTALIIGAGPAGLTAAFELLKHTDIHPIILEASDCIGGISKTVQFKKNRMDIGGHRFFSKSDEIIDWWLQVLPLDKKEDSRQKISYQNSEYVIRSRGGSTQHADDDVMLVRKRKSRILYNKKFFDYPITLSFQTLGNLGLIKIVKIGYSYVLSRIFPIRDEKNLEDFFINRFGRELYLTFFKSYTEKVWGKKCTEIGADWGRQRIKGLSVTKTITDAFSRFFRKGGFRQKNVETSLIEYFLYPKYGPGHMWEVVSEKIKQMGGEMVMNSSVFSFEKTGTRITEVAYRDVKTGNVHTISPDYVFSTMPIDKVLEGMKDKEIKKEIFEIGTSLEYRNFITIGILIPAGHLEGVTDNWIYIHEPDVFVGRIQFFHNWSESMVESTDKHLLGLEYFCDEGDELWNMSEEDLKNLAYRELVQIGILDSHEHILDFHIEKVEKAYPTYAGVYKDFGQVRDYLNTIENLYPIGRNGMHRYNNQDHSMLTAIASVQSILGNYEKEDIWNINADQEYHEGK